MPEMVTDIIGGGLFGYFAPRSVQPPEEGSDKASVIADKRAKLNAWFGADAHMYITSRRYTLTTDDGYLEVAV